LHVRPWFPPDLPGGGASQKLESSPGPTALQWVSTSDKKIKQSLVAKPLASTIGADISAYRAATAFDRPDLLDANAQAPRRAPRMAGAALLAQLVEHLHGKEGVDGSSPSEGLKLSPA
jgi:hypothetical protein